MVFCTYCGQSFTRDEHLERHILTHTNVKPFKCFTCHMSFARRDLLQRHYTVHGKDQNQEIIPAANGMIPKSAGRTPIACSNCAKTKTKCDKKFPCSRCSARNLKCTLRPTRRATKGMPRVGSDGAVSAMQGMSIDTVAPSQQEAVLTPPPRPPLKPATAKNVSNIDVDRKTQPTVDGAPLQFIDGPTSGPSTAMPIMSATPTLAPAPGFLRQTPLPMDDFARPHTQGSSSASSPDFALDWSQLQMPLGYENVVQPQMLMNHSPESLFDVPLLPLGAHNGASADGLLAMLPTLTNGVLTPEETPDVERTYEDMDASMAKTAASAMERHMTRPSIHSVHSMQSMSSASDLSIEMPAIIAAQDAWSSFRCTPTMSSAACPKTARLHLERLEHTLKNHEGWANWIPAFNDPDWNGGDHLTVMQLHESTRDKLLAIMQSFLHKALEIHREGSAHHHLAATGLPTPSGSSNFVLLPPARVLEYFLRSYANCFERYYPLTSRGTLDPNELLHCYNDRAASLLVLMMIAQGATVEARMLTGGLTEATRISLFDLIEKNIIMASDPIVLHAALLFTVQAAWSGDKWQMDIAKGQRNMYFSMLRHSGALESRAPPPTASVDQRANVNTDTLWVEWIQVESRSRLVYSSVMIDQEMALFNDMPPLISVTECVTPMPDADQLWHSRTAAQWAGNFEQVHEFAGGYSSVGSGVRPPSLRDLFGQFLDDDVASRGIEMTPLQLRLLLSPLQSQVTQLSQLLTCFPEAAPLRSSTARGVSKSSTRDRLAEIQCLLGRWFGLAERYLKNNVMCAMMQTNLVLFHLISLVAVTDFAEIERLARRETLDVSYQRLAYLHKRCISDVEEAVFHSGQVLRLVRNMPRGIRPPWWAAAVYRAALILWADSLGSSSSAAAAPKDPTTSTTAASNNVLAANNNGSGGSNMFPLAGPGPHSGAGSGQTFAIDSLPADHPLIVRYLTKREGVPCVTKRDGTLMSIDQSFAMLQHCVQVVDEGAATRFTDGIRAKLERLARS